MPSDAFDTRRIFVTEESTLLSLSVSLSKKSSLVSVSFYTPIKTFIAVQRQKIKQNIGFITSVSSIYKKQLSF